MTADKQTVDILSLHSSEDVTVKHLKSSEWSCLKISSTVFLHVENNTLKVVTLCLGIWFYW